MAGRLGGGEGERLAEVAREAFVEGLSDSLLAGAAVFALGALGVLLLGPRRDKTDLGTRKERKKA